MDSRDPRNNYKQRENLSRRRAAPERQEPLRKYVDNDNSPARSRQRNSSPHEYENDLNSPTRMNRKKIDYRFTDCSWTCCCNWHR